MEFQFHSGWSYDAPKIAAAVRRMEDQGKNPHFAAAMPSLAGLWKRLQGRGFAGVWAQDDELKVLGHFRETNTQIRGTCVMQGTSRAAEDTHISRIADGAIVGRYARLSYEAAYGGCRQKFGWGRSHDWGCQCGRCPDGLMGANGAEWLATQGIIERGVYAGTDLTQPREDLAILWGNQGGISQQILAAGTRHLFSAHKAANLDEFADGLSNKCWGAVCLPEIFKGDRVDSDGYCLPSGPGGHCTECNAILLDPDKRDAFGFQQSWPLGAVHYRKEIKYAGGIKTMRPGSYVMRRSTLERYAGQWELWLYDIVGRNSFRG